MAEGTYKIIWSPEAFENYIDVVEYLLANWSAKAANDFIDIVESKIKLISSQPFIGAIAEKNSAVRSILLTQHNRLYYEAFRDRIELLIIFDTRQNPAKNPFE